MTIINTTKTLRPRQDRDFYPTQPELAEAALELIYRPTAEVQKILDPGCGQGIWGTAARKYWPDAWIDGIDIQLPEVGHPGLNSYTVVDQFDYLDNIPLGLYDLVIGNPPYRLAEEFVRRSWASLFPGGQIIFLLRLAFLASRKRATGLFDQMRPKAVYVLATRPSFTGDGKSDDNEYALFHWQRDVNPSQTYIYWYDWKAKKIC